MKILYWNVRGLGDVRKRGMIKDILKKIGPDMVVIQETKKENFDRKDVSSIWGSKFKEWVFLPSLGRSGGMVVVWNTKSVEVSD